MSSTLGGGRKQGLLYLLLLLRLGNTRSVVTTHAVAVFLTRLTPGRYRCRACVRVNVYTTSTIRHRMRRSFEDPCGDTGTKGPGPRPRPPRDLF